MRAEQGRDGQDAGENAKTCEAVLRRILREGELKVHNSFETERVLYFNTDGVVLQGDEFDILESLQEEELEAIGDAEEAVEEEKKSLLNEVEELLGLSGEQLTDVVAVLKEGLDTAKRIVAGVREIVEPEKGNKCPSCGRDTLYKPKPWTEATGGPLKCANKDCDTNHPPKA